MNKPLPMIPCPPKHYKLMKPLSYRYDMFCEIKKDRGVV
jgi:hypothetical protein